MVQWQRHIFPILRHIHKRVDHVNHSAANLVISRLGSSFSQGQLQRSWTRTTTFPSISRPIYQFFQHQGSSSTTQLLANSSEETPVSSPLAPVSLLGSSKGEDQNQKAVTKAEKVQAVLKRIRQGSSSTTQLLANSSEETPVSSPLAPVSLLGSSKGEDQNQKAVTKAEKVQAVLKRIRQGSSSTTQLLANSSEETPVSSPLAPVSLLGSSKGEDQNQKAVTKAEKVQAVLKRIRQGSSSTTQLLANSSEETPVSSPLAPVSLLGSSKGEDQNQKAVTKAEKVQAVLKRIRQGSSSTTQLLANSSEETPVSSPLAPVSLLGSSKGEDQNQKAVTKAEKVQAVLKRIRQGSSSTTQLLANSSEETPVSSPLAPVSLLGSSKGEDQNQKAVTKAEKVQAVLKRIRQGSSSTTQLLANSSEETPVSSPLAPVSLLGSSKGEDQNQKAVTKTEKVQAVLKRIRQGISSTTQLLANSSEETPVSSPLAPVSLLGSSKGEDQNQKAVTKAEKVQAVLKRIRQGISSTTQLLANSSEETPVSSPLAPVSLLGSSKGEDQNQKAVTKAEKVQAVLKRIRQGISSTTQLLANSSEETPVSSPLAPVSLLGSSKGEEQNQKAVTKAEKVQAVLKGIRQV